MREIKFRAWHNNRMVCWSLFRNDDTYLLDEEVSIDEDEDFIMQYTGLKDKNGKDIYEGDIVQGVSPSIYIVHWNSERVSFAEHAILRFADGTEKDMEDSQPPFPTKWSKMEVIGNIYENKELLEGGSIEE